MLHISWTQYAAVATIVALGAVAQGTVGFGLNLVAAPVVGLVAPELLPATMIVVGAPLSAAIAVAGRRHIDWRGVGLTSIGRLPGTALGAAVVAVVSTRVLGGVVGGAVVVACGVTLLSNEHRIGVGNSIAAGTASGFMDTAAATGGPPLALLYQHRPASEVRATLATSFLVGTVLSLGGLIAGGAVAAWQLWVAAALAPALAVGLGASRLVARRLEGRSVRPLVLGFAFAAGVATLTKSIVV